MESTTYSLDQYRTDAENVLKQKQQSAKQAADVSYQKLLKYLPHQTAGQSIGMTETAKIAANNSYQRALASADSEYAAGMTDLLNNYRAEKQAEMDRVKADQDAFYNDLITSIEAGEFNTTSELENYINSAKGKVSDDQMIALERKLNFYKNDSEQQAADQEYKNTHDENGNLIAQPSIKTADDNGTAITVSGYLKNTDAGNNFKIGDYTVELGDAVAEGVLPAGSTDKVKDGAAFEYNGALYLKKNGVIYTVRGRGGKMSADGYTSALALFKK